MPATIRVVLHVAVSKGWGTKQLDVKNAFLHEDLTETIYMHQSPRFVDKSKPQYVCKLQKAIYGLKQAPRAWNARFTKFTSHLGFLMCKSDNSLFVYKKDANIAYLMLYVDDIILTGSSQSLIDEITMSLEGEFPMTDGGKLSYFLSVKADHNEGGIMLSQSHYAREIVLKAGMIELKPISTHVDVNSKLSSYAGDKILNPTEYRSLAGALQYLTFTRPDITYAVQQICLYMHDPQVQHMQALRIIIRYIQGTQHHGLQLFRGKLGSLTAYTNSDWAGCSDTRRSTSGYCVYLGENLISWSSKRQQTMYRSSAEAEYKGVANVVAETCWIRNLLLEMHCPMKTATLVFCDNISSVYLSNNPVQHQRIKHIEIDLHFVREKVALGQVKVIHVPSSLQFADIFKKGLPTTLFKEFRSSLTVRSSDDFTAGG